MSDSPDQRLSQSLYAQLRGIAAAHLRRERSGHTLDPTALVHEAYLRLCDQRNLVGVERTRWLAAAARHMRQVLLDHARRRHRLKRGGPEKRRVDLLDGHAVVTDRGLDLLDLGDALERLGSLSARQAEVVTLRFFGGMSSDETAEALDVSPRTVESDWQFARAWLRRELT